MNKQRKDEWGEGRGPHWSLLRQTLVQSNCHQTLLLTIQLQAVVLPSIPLWMTDKKPPCLRVSGTIQDYVQSVFLSLSLFPFILWMVSRCQYTMIVLVIARMVWGQSTLLLSSQWHFCKGVVAITFYYSESPCC